MITDRFGRALGSLRLSVTDRCNLRCSYCMPEENYRWLSRGHLLSFEELTRVVRVFQKLGVQKLRLTGGEPLLRKDLEVLVGQLKSLGLAELAITTNATMLAAQAAGLRRAGIDRFTVSLDTLDPERFRQLSRRQDLERVLEGIESVAHTPGLKIDTVLLRGQNDDEIERLLEFAASMGAELRFIEYMDVGGATRWNSQEVVTASEILARLKQSRGPIAPLEASPEAPARRYSTGDGQAFGIIASVSEPFCRSCDRARLTADGKLLMCLYATDGIDLREPLRDGADDEELAELISRTWQLRTDRGAEARSRLPQRGTFVSLESLKQNLHLEMHKRGG